MVMLALLVGAIAAACGEAGPLEHVGEATSLFAAPTPSGAAPTLSTAIRPLSTVYGSTVHRPNAAEVSGSSNPELGSKTS